MSLSDLLILEIVPMMLATRIDIASQSISSPVPFLSFFFVFTSHAVVVFIIGKETPPLVVAVVFALVVAVVVANDVAAVVA